MEKDINEEIEKIWERNKRVELDKKWETSFTRRAFICLITYAIVVIYSFMIQKISNVWLSSLVPVIGFTLSTLSLKIIRNIWEKSIKQGE